MKNICGEGAIEKGSANWQFAPLPLSDIDRSSSDARKGLGLTEGFLIERRKLPVCATFAQTIFPFHYSLIRGFVGQTRTLKFTGGRILCASGAQTRKALLKLSLTQTMSVRWE